MVLALLLLEMSLPAVLDQESGSSARPNVQDAAGELRREVRHELPSMLPSSLQVFRPGRALSDEPSPPTPQQPPVSPLANDCDSYSVYSNTDMSASHQYEEVPAGGGGTGTCCQRCNELEANATKLLNRFSGSWELGVLC